MAITAARLGEVLKNVETFLRASQFKQTVSVVITGLTDTHLKLAKLGDRWSLYVCGGEGERPTLAYNAQLAVRTRVAHALPSLVQELEAARSVHKTEMEAAVSTAEELLNKLEENLCDS